ncbi:MAG: type I methionyl aminopeptidase [candidate division NC10 bacterium]|nr:type I methionyl aminopeptidase [candidate division NC10 bacterium]MBI4390701.1 type I methionyl aminopeptidase [candidate division NC10 bacterium]
MKGHIEYKAPWEIELLRKANRLVAEALQAVAARVAPGVRTADLDTFAEEYLRKRGATPAFKGYRDYPFSLCVSVNEEVVHGLPSERRLRDGDIVSLDLGTIVDGYYGDSALTVPVGQVSPEAARLLRVTEEALMRGIGAARLGGHLSDISHAVQSHVEAHGFSVVRIFVGHGIGKALHEDPQIPNYGPPGRGPRLKPGMVLAIEPMVNAGGPEVEILPDNWTAVTKDRSLSAHFEHTIALTEQGVEILTQP